MAEINLLPAKEFEIILSSGDKIEGKFGTWQAKRFCDKKKLSLSGLIELMQEEIVLDENGKPVEIQIADKDGNVINVPKTRSKLSMDDICLLLLCAVEYKSKKANKGFAYTDIDACEWIEELGGVGSDLYGKLMGHAASEIKTEGDKPDEEKKSL